MQMFTGFLPESQTSGADVAAPTDKSTQHPQMQRRSSHAPERNTILKFSSPFYAYWNRIHGAAPSDSLGFIISF